jgi:hypothetical protein
MFRYQECEIDRIIRRKWTCLLSGLGAWLLLLMLPPEWKFGGILGFAWITLGFYAALLQKWRTEPGLWMMATFLTLSLGACYGFFAYRHYAAVFAPQPAKPVAARIDWGEVLFFADVCCALAVFHRQVKLTFSVAILNWQQTRKRKS